MHAEVKRFSAIEHTKVIKKGWPFGDVTVIDWQSYYQAIRNFLTTLGPTKVIGVQSPAHDYRYDVGGITDVWYWVE